MTVQWEAVLRTVERMIASAGSERIATILGEICAELSLRPSDVLNLPKKRTFKLDARFNARQ